MRSVPTVRLILATAFTGVSCLVAGAVADAIGVPLGWILGPMVAAAVVSLSGVRFWFPILGQRIGQGTIGAAIGMYLTGSALVMLLPLVPLMFLVGVLGMVFGAVASLILVRFARLDCKTAYFSMMPGGLAEMANIADTVGARREPVALVQAIRLAIVVSVLPPLVLAFSTPRDAVSGTPVDNLVPLEIVAVFGAAGLGVLLARRLRLNNHWMIGAMVGAGLASASGLLTGAMPIILVNAGQLLLGIAIGARFQRDILRKLFGIAFVAVFAIGAKLALLVGLGLTLAMVTHADVATSILATAPGGLPEMTVTAQVLQLNVAFVTVFQLVRAFLVNGFAVHVMGALERLGFFRIAERVGRE